MLDPAFRPGGGRSSPGARKTEKAGAGAPPDAGRTPAVRRGWRTRGCIRRCAVTRGLSTEPGDVVQHRPSPEVGRSASRSSRALPPRGPAPPAPTDPVPGRLCRTRSRLPGGSARCTRASRREVEARTVVRHVGRRPDMHRRKGARAAEVGLQGRELSGTESSVAVTRGRGRPVTACSRWSGGRRPAAGCRGRASVHRSGAGLRLSRRRRAGPYGNELREEFGDLDRRAGPGDPRAGQDSGSPRAWTRPVGTPDPETCRGQPVARERSGGPLGLTPGTATAPRGTGGIHRGPAGAGRRRVSSAAEEDAAG